MKIYKFVFLLLFILNTACANQNSSKTLFVANWNVENLFDTVDDPGKADEEFLPGSPRRWTENRLEVKLNHLAKVIKFMNDFEGPDILGLEEVEHKSLLNRLINSYLNEKNYQAVEFESPDKRGIDCALIYNARKLKLIASEPLKIDLPGGKTTRDILHAEFLLNGKIKLHVFVNHWPSRREGLKKTEPKRIAAATVLKKNVEKILSANKNSKIFILGDFNDLPSNISISKVLGAKPFYCKNESATTDTGLYNLSYELFQQGKGTYKYKTHWNMLDQIIVSGSIIKNGEIRYECNSFQIIKPVYMITKSSRHKGKPKPTYGGRKYLGGFADHFPVGAKFIF